MKVKISKLVALVCLFWMFLVSAVAEGDNMRLTLGVKIFSLVCGSVMVYCLYRWRDDNLFDGGIFGEKEDE